MANRIDFVGKIRACKETDNFKPYDKRTFDSGWSKTTLKFNVVCGSNRHFMESSVLTPKDLEDVNIYTVAQYEGEEKAHKETVNYADRFDPEIVAAVSPFKKYVVDTEIPNRRKELKSALTAFEDGSITDETMQKLGITSLEQCKDAFEKSCKKRHEFIWEGDFLDYLVKFVNNEKIKDMNWHIMGEYALEYNNQSDVWYRKFKPQKIYRADDNAEAKSQAEFTVTFGRDAIDDNDFEETGKIHINGFITQYLGQPYKKNCFAPMQFTLDGSKDDSAKKKAVGFKRKFVFPDESDADFREIGIVCDILDGAQVVEFTEDMLTDEEREDIEYGLSSFEEIKAAHNKEVYGDKVTDIVITSLARNFVGKGATDTAFTTEDVGKPRCELDEDKAETEEVEKVFPEVDDDDEI